MVVRGMITFLKYDHRTLQEALSQSHSHGGTTNQHWVLKTQCRSPQVEIKQAKKADDETKINSRIINWK